LKRIITSLLLLVLLGTQVLSFKNAEASFKSQISPETQKAQDLLDKMTPEERVGQLFLVTFMESNTDSESPIVKLIREQHVGGVVFRADNDNFSVTDDLPTTIQNAINSLQVENWKSTITGIQTESGTVQPGGNYIPLFIGISQEGDLAPYDQIINGLTPLPSAMAIGATWKPSNAEAVGKVLGNEINALGFNLLFGPSLDVLDLVRTDIGEDLGVRTFGGDPYWVSQFGKAYIQGVHEGSNNQVLVIAKHFPGRGGSDRLPEDEVATVRKSLEQLKQIELSPFSAVTQFTDNRVQQTDGLLLSHIRYQGFQGNIRATTRPVSFDETALDLIMALEPFAGWRDQGGLIISDDLGSAAVKKFFAPTGTNYDARQVAKSALLAGNDILYLGNLQSSNDESTYATVVKTHEYFVQKYKEDPVFQQRVDKAVLRILTSKYKLYPYFSLGIVTTQSSRLQTIGISQQVTFDVARQSITLVSPSLKDLNSDLPNPPKGDDQVVFISNTVPQTQCSSCADQSIFLAGDMMNAVNKLYGSGAGDLVQANHLSAFTFEDLHTFLDGENNNNPNLGNSLAQADWVIFAFTEFRMNSEESVAFQRLFSEKPSLVQNKKIIGFAFNAPYYPDATDISKFTAYFALYSKTPQFIEIAARTLFKEISPIGILPVSVSSVGYDLISATTPDPSQVIPLMVIQTGEGQGEVENSSTTNNASITITAGGNLPLQTGIIKDQNGNQVPDGTIVHFIIDTQTASGTVEQIESQTTDGIARTVYRIPDKGTVKLSVVAEPAIISQILQIEITNEGGTLTSINPTLVPTGPAVIEPTPVNPTNNPSDEDRHQKGLPGLFDWFVATLIVIVFTVTLYQYGKKNKKIKWNPSIPVVAGITGYMFYLFPLFGLTMTQNWMRSFGIFAVALLVFCGCLLGTFVAIITRQFRK